MVEQVLLALQALFLLLLYVFVWRVVRSASRDLRVAPQESFVMAPAQAAQAGIGVPVAAAPGRLVVVRSSAARPGSALDVGPVPVTIGRAAGNVLALPGDEFASSEHARIDAARDGVWLSDLRSTNGTFVNGQRVNGRRRLRSGDVVAVGNTELRFEQ